MTFVILFFGMRTLFETAFLKPQFLGTNHGTHLGTCLATGSASRLLAFRDQPGLYQSLALLAVFHTFLSKTQGLLSTNEYLQLLGCKNRVYLFIFFSEYIVYLFLSCGAERTLFVISYCLGLFFISCILSGAN